MQPLCINDIKSIQGIEFVDLQKTDSGFNRFVSGTAKGISCTFITTLRKKRNMAMIGHTDTKDIMGNELPAPSRHTVNKMKQGMTNALFVDIEFPEVHVDDQHAPATTLRVATTKDFNMLHYVRVAMLATMVDESVTKRTKPTVYAPAGTRWIKRTSHKNATKYGFLACRQQPGNRQKTEFIVCDDVNDIDTIERARRQTLRWFDGHDDVEDDAAAQSDGSGVIHAGDESDDDA